MKKKICGMKNIIFSVVFKSLGKHPRFHAHNISLCEKESEEDMKNGLSVKLLNVKIFDSMSYAR